MAEPRRNRKLMGIEAGLLVRGLLLIATLAALGWGIKVTGLAGILDTHWIDSEVRGHGLAGQAAFVAIGALMMAVGLPRQAVCFLAGYAFGFGGGLAVASLASVLGCIACFTYARLLARDLLLHKHAAKVRRIDDFLAGSPFTMTVLVRFLPVGSNLLTNLLAGVSSVRPGAFFAGSLIGYLPQTAVFVLLGSGVNVDPGLRTVLSMALFGASAAMGVFLYRRLRRGRSLGSEVDQAVYAEAEETQA